MSDIPNDQTADDPPPVKVEVEFTVDVEVGEQPEEPEEAPEEEPAPDEQASGA